MSALLKEMNLEPRIHTRVLLGRGKEQSAARRAHSGMMLLPEPLVTTSQDRKPYLSTAVRGFCLRNPNSFPPGFLPHQTLVRAGRNFLKAILLETTRRLRVFPQ